MLVFRSPPAVPTFDSRNIKFFLVTESSCGVQFAYYLMGV
jgi:hypothetical protein